MRSVFIAVLSLIFFSVSGQAAPLETPEGKVLLTIEGKITSTNQADRALFDLQMLEKLPQKTIKTSTSWTDGLQEFQGVLVSDLLQRVGAQGSALIATASNDYAVTIPISEFTSFPVIIAIKHNGAYMGRRNKGPLWIVYPKDSFDEIGKDRDPYWIWSLKKIRVQ